MTGDASPRQRVVAALAASRKYREVCADTLAAVASDALARSRDERDAVKRAKRKLHQIFGAYRSDDLVRKLGTRLSDSPADTASWREAALAAMALHVSTRERTASLASFYPAIFELTGTPRTVHDLACGLNPLTIPWMELAPGATYVGYDIDGELMRSLGPLLDPVLDGTGPAVRCECRDVLIDPPVETADVALLFKAFPCFERQRPGSTLDLLRALDARYLVLSAPRRSIGGTDRGMESQYERQVEAFASRLGREWARVPQSVGAEAVYVVG